VDLLHPHAQGKSKNPRFRERIFLPEEESLLLADREPDAMLWALWTGKEAAFKAIQKDSPEVASIPRRYHVQFSRAEEREQANSLPSGERRLSGAVTTPRGVLHLETLITATYVHSIASSLPASPGITVVWEVERMPVADASPAYESLYVRAAAQRHLARYLVDMRPQDIEIRRVQGPRGLAPPCVYVRGRLTDIDISLSHEGAYGAYAFALFSASK
jgi:phosphopantetheinyl transferase (holo-ACP synthase)